MREEALSHALANELERRGFSYVVPEMRAADLWPSPDGNEDRKTRFDVYAYDGRRGSGREVILEVKRGGDGSTDLTTPYVFAWEVLKDIGKLLWVGQKSSRLAALSVALWCAADSEVGSPPVGRCELRADNVRRYLTKAWAEPNAKTGWPVPDLWDDPRHGIRGRKENAAKLAWLAGVAGRAGAWSSGWIPVGDPRHPVDGHFSYLLLVTRVGRTRRAGRCRRRATSACSDRPGAGAPR